jgi:hypothetical protein
MFIDCHVHLRRTPGFPRRGKQPYATPEQLLERFDAVGIERAVVMVGVSPECAYEPQSNEEVLEVARENDRFVPLCNVDPRALTNSVNAPLTDILLFYRDRGARGVGEVTANLAFVDPLVQNLFQSAQAADMPLTFHVSPRIGSYYGLYDPPGLPGLEESLARFPELKLVGHSQPFWAEIAPLDTVGSRNGYPREPVTAEGALPKLMRKYPNLYGDLSANSGYNALARDEEHAARFLDEFQDRLLFGTDIAAPDTPTPLVDLLLRLREEDRISEQVFRKVARDNAIKLFQL